MGAWLDARSDWRRSDDGRWEVLVRYSVTHANTTFNYLATFDVDDVRRVVG
jgi:hypothetical protein